MMRATFISWNGLSLRRRVPFLTYMPRQVTTTVAAMTKVKGCQTPLGFAECFGTYGFLSRRGYADNNVTAKKQSTDSSVQVTTFNFNEVVQWKNGLVILILYLEASPEAKHFIANVKEAVATWNSPGKQQIRVALIDCGRELELAQRFQVDRTGVPATYFLFKGGICERFVGIMHPPQITAMLTMLMKSLASELTDPVKEKPASSMESLLDHSRVALQEGNTEEAITSVKQVLESVETRLETFKSSIGFGKRKVSPEMLNKLRENDDAQVTLQCIIILAQCALHPGSPNSSDAAVIVSRLKSEFPWSVKESREVGEVIAKVEMQELVTMEERDTVESLSAPISDDAPKEYERCLKLACRYFLMGNMKESMDTLLHVIARETKLLQKQGNRTTPARRMIVLLFDAAGNDSPLVKEGRKKLSTYLFC